MSKLLLVDDDSATRDALKRTLRMDFEIVEASSAAEALEILAKTPNISMVLADEKMPGKTGTELLLDVKRLYPSIVRIILSGHIKLEQMMVAINKAEIHRFLLKPWDNEVLRLQIHEALIHHNDLDEISRLQKLAITDPVTNLTNHRYFQERIRTEIERSSRHSHIFSLIMADVDHFKDFNDKYGHPAGDRALAQIAQTLNRSTRLEDSVSRYGGEEFTILLPETTPLAALEVADRMRRDLENTAVGGTATPHSVTISMGIASYPQDGSSADQIIKAADVALYRAKERGRNRVELYQPK